MTKTTTAIILGMILISFTSALYSGECESLDISDFENLTNLVYTVEGNSSNLDGLNVSINNNTIEICTLGNFKPDNFTIILLDNLTKTVEKEKIVYKSGGSKTKYIYENITEYIEIEKFIEKTIECNETNKTIKIIKEVEKEKIRFIEKIWGWISSLKSNLLKYIRWGRE